MLRQRGLPVWQRGCTNSVETVSPRQHRADRTPHQTRPDRRHQTIRERTEHPRQLVLQHQRLAADNPPDCPGNYPVSKAITSTIDIKDVVPLGFDVLSDPQGAELKILVRPLIGRPGPIRGKLALSRPRRRTVPIVAVRRQTAHELVPDARAMGRPHFRALLVGHLR